MLLCIYLDAQQEVKIVETLESLWNEVFSEKCAAIDTEEEKELLKKAGEMHGKVISLLTKEQCDMLDQYVDAVYETQEGFIKKAFFKGCKFAASLCLETKD